MKASAKIRVGCAAGFSGDRLDAAAPVVKALIDAGGPAFLIFETLAERTLALAQLSRRENPAGGYEPLLAEMLKPVLRNCLDNGIRIVSNFGAANPQGAAQRIHRLAEELGCRRPKIAVISGDDMSTSDNRALIRDSMTSVGDPGRVISANAYIGAKAIAAALRAGADIVVGGRIADSSLTVGPALAHFAWADDDWTRIARAAMAGHLLECGTQITGGYFADPGFKDVAGLATLGYPIAEIDDDGLCIISKPPGTGGIIDARTVKEQLLYEVHEPSAYTTPDVVIDLSEAEVRPLEENRVLLSGVRGHPAPPELKVSVCYENGWIAEGEISYSGARAEARAKLAAKIIRERMAGAAQLRADIIGAFSTLASDDGAFPLVSPQGEARDVRLRIALRHADRDVAERLTREVNALFTCGPAGGGGVRTSIRPRLGIASCMVPRGAVQESYEFAGIAS